MKTIRSLGFCKGDPGEVRSLLQKGAKVLKLVRAELWHGTICARRRLLLF